MNNCNNKLDFSIIVPVYCNETSLKELYSRLQIEVIQQNPLKNYEIIFVDDGSYDRSLDVLFQLKKIDPHHLKIIKLTRNFGQLSAILAGYQSARGSCIVNISADLQDPPSLINEMLNACFNEQHDIVICFRKSRDESLFRRLTSALFYKTIKKLSFPDMPVGGFDFFLISHTVKEFILKNLEANAFLQGQLLWLGYKIKYIPYERKRRETGESKWSFSKKIKHLIDGVMSYSYFPLRAMTVTGLIVAVSGFVYAIDIIISRLFGNISLKGWAPLMVTLLILSGIQMIMLGVIGEYLWRTLDQVRNRPLFIVEKIYD
jgi:polyisoprenyl-phosphate glycosyltransferase